MKEKDVTWKNVILCEKTRGDVIVYFDDDDYYPPERITHAVDTLRSNKKALILVRVSFIFISIIMKKFILLDHMDQDILQLEHLLLKETF